VVHDHLCGFNPRSRPLRFAALLGLLGCAAACASPPPRERAASASEQSAQTYGYLVVGDTLAADLGLPARDTAREVLATSVSPALVRVADSVARLRKRPTACTRYFRAESYYVLLTDADCGPDRAVLDGSGFTVLDSLGRAQGRWPYYPNNNWNAVLYCPAFRDVHGTTRGSVWADGCMHNPEAPPPPDSSTT
jgi:hypothetical protein